jgi:superfamily II DNA or RNA helicase
MGRIGASPACRLASVGSLSHMRVVLRDIDPQSLVDVFGPVRYAVATQLVKRRAVVQSVWVESQQALCGVVRGGNGEFYTPAVYFITAEEGSLEIDRDQCSCRSKRQCEHAAALLLAASEAVGGAVQVRAAPVAQKAKPPSWDRELESLLSVQEPAQQKPRTSVAVELTISTGAKYQAAPRLMARLVQPGKNGGWIAGNLSWSRLDVMYTRDFPAAQVQVLREFLALYRARASSGSYYYSYGEEKYLELSAFDSRQLWALLEQADAAGIRFVYSKTLGGGDVARYGGAQVCLDVTKDGEELRLLPRLRAEPAEGELVPVVFLGAEPHGVAWVRAINYDDGPEFWRFAIAPLTEPVQPGIRKLALGRKHLSVPAEAEPEFRQKFYPRLRRAAPVISSDESFVPPEISAPTLVLRATYGEGHDLNLDWQWNYRVGDSSLSAGLGEPDDDPGFRDLKAERELLGDLPVRPGDMDQLAGLDTMRFTTELMPLLASQPDVRLEVEGTPADYREASDSVQIGVSVDESASDSTDWFDLGVTITVEGREVPFMDVFLALSRGDTHLLLLDGAYFSLEKPELMTLRTLIEEARALTDSEGPLRLSPFQAGLWDELAALGVVSRQASAWQEKVRGLLSMSELPAVPAPGGLEATLRPYQLEGFAWLAFLWEHQLGGILADDMGLGKTLQSLALIAHARAARPADAPFLIVAPTSVVPNWAAEAARFTPGLKCVAISETGARRDRSLDEAITEADFVVTSYTLFRLEFEHYAKLGWSAMILDEAQSFKNHQSKIYQCVRKLGAPVKLAITGTPMENNLMELWSLLSVTAPGLFPRPDRFRDYYAQPIERGRDAELLAQLRRRIKPLMKRRTKEQVAADLPAKQEQLLSIELHPKHRTVYQRQLQRERQKVLGLIDDMNANRFTILRSLTKLRQLALHAALVDPADGGVPCAKIDALLEQLADVVDGGHRALVFSQFTSFLELVRSRLSAAGISFCYLDGRTRDRGSVLSSFKEGSAPVFLISLKAGGFGLNLTEADYCFLLDPWWNPQAEEQAIDRTHRIGQTRNVMVYRLIAKDTIEEKVLALNARKAELFANVMDEGNTFGSALTPDDIRHLFA